MSDADVCRWPSPLVRVPSRAATRPLFLQIAIDVAKRRSASALFGDERVYEYSAVGINARTMQYNDAKSNYEL